MNRQLNRWLLVALVISSCLLDADDAQARRRKPKPVVSVANNGLDSAECGNPSTPCRSITMGITRARALGRGTVSVHPGLYGDLDGNGVSSGFGEERLPIPVTDIRVVSRAGAARTLIRANNPSPLLLGVVRVEGVGGKAFFSGFTIQGGGSSPGISISNAAAENLVLTGHGIGAWVAHGGSLSRSVAIRNTQHGIVLNGEGKVLDSLAIANAGHGFQISNSGVFVVQGCQAIRNASYGFLLSTFPTTQGSFAHNLALANGNDGIFARGPAPVDLVSNVSSANGGSGFNLNDSASRTLHSNVATANRRHGVQLSRADDTIDRLRAIGNRGSGMEITRPGITPPVVRRSALFGNNVCQVWSNARGTDVDLDHPYVGDPSRCRTNFFLPFTNTASSEGQALAIRHKKKGKKKKKRKKGPAGAPWPLQP